MEKRDYSIVENQDISDELKELIEEYAGEDAEGVLESDNRRVITVKSPFILADNCFDLHESNNDIVEINVERTKSVSFTGGNFYIEYVKTGDDAYVIQGNEEEGYNIFNLI